MGQFSTQFQPPKTWQDFEELAQAVLTRYHDSQAIRHGRIGQRQDGVDVYVQSPRTGHWIGVQCKQMDENDDQNQPLPGGKITRQYLVDQARAATKFRPQLDEFVLATTSKPSVLVQRFAREVSEEFSKRGHFRVNVWAWDQFEAALNAYVDLQQHYYQNVIGVRTADDQDRMIIHAIGESFRRAAFITPIGGEHADDFLQALKDTTTMLAMGWLVSRETRAVLYRTVGGASAISDDATRAKLQSVKDAVQQLREDLEAGLKDGRVVRKNGYVEFRDRALEASLGSARSSVVKQVSAVLRSRNMAPL